MAEREGERGADGLAERFVVGTAYLDDDSAESARGRILIFEVTESRQLKLVAEQALRGACRCLSMCQGNIVAALIKTVSTILFSELRSYILLINFTVNKWYRGHVVYRASSICSLNGCIHQNSTAAHLFYGHVG